MNRLRTILVAVLSGALGVFLAGFVTTPRASL